MKSNGTLTILIGVTLAVLVLAAVFKFRTGETPDVADGTRLTPEMIDFTNVGFEPNAVTVAPGVHLLGRVVPGNAYAIETSAGLILVDCGLQDDASFVIRQLEELNLDVDTLKKVLISHIHADHCQGAAYLRERTGAEIYAGAGDAPLLEAGEDKDAFFSKYTMAGLKLHPTTIDVALNGGETIQLGDTKLTAIATPGHSPGSMCYRLERDGLSILFTGDTISSLTGELGTYITKLPPRFRGNATDYLASLTRMKTSVTPDMVLPGHTEDDPVGQSPWVKEIAWNQILDRAESELNQVIARYEADGRDFLGDEPFKIQEELFFLGKFRDRGMYAFQSGEMFVLFDAPSGRDFIEFLTTSFDHLNLVLSEKRYVCLTSCDARNAGNLGELVRQLRFDVIAPSEGIDGLRKRCPDNTRFVTSNELSTIGLGMIRPFQLGGIGEHPVAYQFATNGKSVVVSGRIPVEAVEGSINQLHREFIRSEGDVTQLRESLRQLGELSPNIWLPATIVNDQNANIYGDQWLEVLKRNDEIVGSFVE